MHPTISQSLTGILAAVALAGHATGAITVYAEYRLGEAGTLGPDNTPLDSIGSRDIDQAINGAGATVGSPGAYPGSTAFMDSSNPSNTGYYSLGNFADLPTNNVAIGVYAKASSNDAGNIGSIFSTGDGGGFDLALHANGWAGSLFNVDWVGPAGGVAGSFTPDTWVHLALIRADGITTFYIDGVAQPGTLGLAPVHSSPHISVSPGGASYFDGGIDGARAVYFDAGESTAAVLNVLTAVPEPSSLAFLGLGGLVVFRRRRRVA
jgi:hypothetical protein